MDTTGIFEHSKASRQQWLDYDKGISIILVSFRHCYESLVNSGLNVDSYPFLEYINVFLFGFRMPLFFIASGIFFSSSLAKRGLRAYSKVRMQNILYPMLMWGSIQLTLQLLFSTYTNVVYGPEEYISLLLDPRRTGQFWYLNALFFVGVLYAFMKVKFRLKATAHLCLGFLMYFSLAQLRKQNIDLGFGMDIMQYYLFFGIGDSLSVLFKSERYQKILNSFKLLFVLVPVFIIVQYQFAKINLTFDNNYHVEHNMPVFFLLVAIVGCVLSLNISFILAGMKKAQFLHVIGYHSIYIFCMQVVIMGGLRVFLIKVLMITHVPLLMLLLLVSGLIFPILAYKLFVRNGMQWLFTLSPVPLK